MIQKTSVFRICLFRVVGMNGMRVVCAEQEGGRDRPAILFLTEPKASINPSQAIFQKCRLCALPGIRSYLLIVKAAEQVDSAFPLRSQESFECGKGTLQVIKPRGRDKLSGSAPDTSPLSVHQKQIFGKKVLRFRAERIGNHPVKITFF